jgi:spore germination protein KA
MADILKTIKRFLIYEKPVEPEGFELLEDENEGMESDSGEQTDYPEENRDKRTRTVKKPIKVANWGQSEKNGKNLQSRPAEETALVPELQANLARLRREFDIPQNQDVVIREFVIGKKMNAAIVFMDGMADKTTINDFILRQLMTEEHFNGFASESLPDLKYITNHILSINQVTTIHEYGKIIAQILNGLTALLVDGCAESLIIETRGFEKRSIGKPITELAVKGSQEAFTENLRTNITLIRRIIKNNQLISEIFPLGKRNKINCGLIYLKGVANPELIKEVKRRIRLLDIDYIGGTGMLENLIEDNPWAPFPQTLSTERPDRATSFVMEEKVLLIVEGTPFAAAMPVGFFQMIQTSEDAFLRWQYGAFLRLIRLLGIFVALLVPGMYIALTLYHQEAIPTDLLAAIVKARENVPFPTILEVLLMEISFELIREAGLRMPGLIGNTLGIVGALILGQAAVAANIVSPILVIVVALTALGSFTVPNYVFSFGIRIARFGFVLLGAIAGFYGIAAGIAVFGGLICGMKSFGVPFLAPVAPKTNSSPDIIIRQPIFKQKDRPDFNNPVDSKRTGPKVRGWIKKRTRKDRE